MKVSLNWLKDFLKTDVLDVGSIADMLTMSGTEVKKVENIGEKYKNLVIGKIIDFYKHPNAEKLSICKVDVGAKMLNIICGAKNFKKNDEVVVALEGANVQNTIIRKTKIRGEISEGMLCSEKELGISQDAEGIMILNDNYKAGEDFSTAIGLDDIVLELEITPNRPDCLSIIGIAREISALTEIELKIPEYDWQDEINIDSKLEIQIEDYKLCPRYSAKIFCNMPNIDSPWWLKNRLILCGIRPVNLTVDLTNYVMLETGQPLHAFDKDLLYSDKIIVRRASQKESIRTIDDRIRILNKDMLVIADEKKAIAIAGIMGGKDTEINAGTKNIILESANFSGPLVMETSKKLGLRSEASNRFEKKIDPLITVYSIKRFEDLLTKISGFKTRRGIYDNFKKIERERNINLRVKKIGEILGKEIEGRTASNILNRLGLKSEARDNIIQTKIPSYRYEDLEREIDLIEEVARIYGYGKIDPKPPLTFLRRGKYNFYQKTIRELRKSLTDIGLDEVINYSFLSKETFKKFRLDLEDNYKNPVKIINPITEDFELLRTSLLPAMAKNVRSNISYNIKDIGIFEISKVFSKNENLKMPIETENLGIVLTGRAGFKTWNTQESFYDYYHLKGILEYIFKKFVDLTKLEIKEEEHKFFHPKISGKILMGGLKVGIIGKVHPTLVEENEIGQDLYYLELNLDKFIENITEKLKYKKIPAYPSIDIDLAIVVEEEVKNADIVNEIRKSGTNILNEIRLFDIYRGKQIEFGKKSMAYTLVFRAEDRTLKDEEVEIVINRILDNLARKYNAKLRSL